MPLLALSDRVRFINGSHKADQSSRVDEEAGVRRNGLLRMHLQRPSCHVSPCSRWSNRIQGVLEYNLMLAFASEKRVPAFGVLQCRVLCHSQRLRNLCTSRSNLGLVNRHRGTAEHLARIGHANRSVQWYAWDYSRLGLSSVSDRPVGLRKALFGALPSHTGTAPLIPTSVQLLVCACASQTGAA